MEIEPINVNCNGKIHKIVKYHLSQKDALLVDCLRIGAELAGKVNIYDPSGIPRDVATRVAKCSGGVIAERIFKDFMENRITEEKNVKEELVNIELYLPQVDYSRGQIDLIVRSRNEKIPLLRIEVRSSFSYITRSIFTVVRYAMSLLGPYVTKVKPTEETKDFHVTVIHRVHPEDLVKHSEEPGIDSFIVGGGTKEMFKDTQRTKIDNLYQNGAAYKTIKPISEGLDAYAIAEEIITRSLAGLQKIQ